MRRPWPIPLLVLLAAVILFGQSGTTHVVVLHTNDIHGHLLPTAGIGGAAEIASIVKTEGADLLLDAGDMYSGTMVSDYFKGESMIEFMNALGYAAAALGNHEFDYGQDALRDRLHQAHFPFLSANVDSPIQEIDDFTIVAVKGIRFGIIGLTTEELTTSTHARNLKNVTLVQLADAVSRTLPRLEGVTEFVIVLGHLRKEEEVRLAKAFPQLRLIIGGHTDEPTPEPLMLGETMVMRAGKFGNYVGRVDLDFRNGKIEDMEGELIAVKDVKPDAEITRLIEPYLAKIDSEMRTVVGEASADLPKSTTAESPLANLIADAIREKTGTDFALTNIGGIRDNLAAGPITAGRLYEILPFPNTLVTMQLSGAQIKRLLGVELAAVSGLRVVVDPDKPKGLRFVSAMRADGTPINDADLYSITTNDFLVAGGDSFFEFANGRETIDTGLTIRDSFIEFIRKRQSLVPLLDGRVKTAP